MKRMMNVVTLLLLFHIGVAGIALAEKSPNCSGTQAQMNSCAGKTLAHEDAALNYWYKLALEKVQDKKAKTLFVNAQRAWIAFRDAQCEYDADVVRGGSMAPAIHASCLAQLTKGRVVQLWEQAVSETGGGSSWPEDLSRLLLKAGDVLPNGIFWSSEHIVSADFDGDGAYDIAALGLIPGNYENKTITYYLVLAASGSEKVQGRLIPVGPSSLCAPDPELRVEYYEDELPYVVVDDGACDAFRYHLYRDGTVELFRN